MKGFHVETEHVLTQLALIHATVKLSGRASTVKQVNVIYGYLVKTMVIGEMFSINCRLFNHQMMYIFKNPVYC